MKRVALGEIEGFSRKRGPVFVYTRAEARPFRMVVPTRCPQRFTAIPPRRAALSIRSREVWGPIETRRVALDPRMKAPRTLALSRSHRSLVNGIKASGTLNATIRTGLELGVLSGQCSPFLTDPQPFQANLETVIRAIQEAH